MIEIIPFREIVVQVELGGFDAQVLHLAGQLEVRLETADPQTAFVHVRDKVQYLGAARSLQVFNELCELAGAAARRALLQAPGGLAWRGTGSVLLVPDHIIALI